MHFWEKLKSGCQKCDLCRKRVLVALSGGADSVALTLALKEIEEELNLEIWAAHLDHQLRGEQSAEDARWVREFCDQLGVPLISETARVTETAEATGGGLEETARRLRYEFLKRAAEENGLSAIVVAHHADDQIETVLHHLLRGTGLQGMAGMPYRRSLSAGIELLRPMLELTREDILNYLQEQNQTFVQDETNQDTRYTRNRIRHELLPLLKQEYSSNIGESLLNLSRQAGDIQLLLEEEARTILKQVLLDSDQSTVRIDKLELATHPRHLIREVFVQLWRQNDWPRQRMTFEHWDRLAGVILNEQEGTSLPGPFTAKRVRKELHFLKNDQG